MVYRVVGVALAPLLYLQGRRARRAIPRLPEPPGERTGTCGDGPRLRILIAGDSAAAGVGAAHQDEALLGRLVSALSPRFTVEWELVAKTGATTASTLSTLQTKERREFDVAVTSLGVNDVTSGSTRDAWRRTQRKLRTLLRDRFGVRFQVVCGVPPVHGFPALPQPLRWCLGRRATEFDRDLHDDVAKVAGANFLSLRFVEDPALMSAAGFHPGPAIYAVWAARAADCIVARFGREQDPSNGRSAPKESPG